LNRIFTDKRNQGRNKEFFTGRARSSTVGQTEVLPGFGSSNIYQKNYFTKLFENFLEIYINFLKYLKYFLKYFNLHNQNCFKIFKTLLKNEKIIS
jgi:hypothetical protein